jgi:hypothetical protein
MKFFGDHHSANLADCRKLCVNCHNGKQTFIFALVFCVQKYMYDGPKYNIRGLDPCQSSRSLNELWQIAPLSVSQSELQQNPLDLRTLILHLWMCYSMDRSFNGRFSTEKCVCAPLLRPIQGL